MYGIVDNFSRLPLSEPVKNIIVVQARTISQTKIDTQGLIGKHQYMGELRLYSWTPSMERNTSRFFIPKDNYVLHGRVSIWSCVPFRNYALVTEPIFPNAFYDWRRLGIPKHPLHRISYMIISRWRGYLCLHGEKRSPRLDSLFKSNTVFIETQALLFWKG